MSADGLVPCSFCSSRIDPDSSSSYRRVSGWEQKKAARPSGSKGGSDIYLREAANEWACSSCIRRLRAGVNVGQEALL